MNVLISTIASLGAAVAASAALYWAKKRSDRPVVAAMERELAAAYEKLDSLVTQYRVTYGPIPMPEGEQVRNNDFEHDGHTAHRTQQAIELTGRVAGIESAGVAGYAIAGAYLLIKHGLKSLFKEPRPSAAQRVLLEKLQKQSEMAKSLESTIAQKRKEGPILVTIVGVALFVLLKLILDTV